MSAAACVVAPGPIDEELAAELEKQSAWVSPRVTGLRVGDDGRTVHFVLTGDDATEVERAKVARFVGDMVERHRPLPRKIVTRRERPERALVRDAFGELLRRGWAVEQGRGRVSLRGPALAVVRAIDEDAARIARRLGADEESHPALASASLLARCGYLASFPQHVSLVTHLVEDYDAIDDFRRRAAGATAPVQPGPGAAAPFDACLLPALCYAVYAAREGSVLERPAIAVTCAGRCFRYESRNLGGAERLWEFGMRELVWIGEDGACGAGRVRAVEAVLDQLERWDLDGTIECASDPFFAPARASRAWWQRSGERKLELRLPIAPAAAEHGPPRAIACASFNLHDRVFGGTFSIANADGSPASSACVGWGFERWMLACFAQHGFDPEAWPSWLARRVFE